MSMKYTNAKLIYFTIEGLKHRMALSTVRWNTAPLDAVLGVEEQRVDLAGDTQWMTVRWRDNVEHYLISALRNQEQA